MAGGEPAGQALAVPDIAENGPALYEGADEDGPAVCAADRASPLTTLEGPSQ